MTQKLKLQLADTDRESNLIFFKDINTLCTNFDLDLFRGKYYENKLLLALSDEEIKEGDFGFYFDDIGKPVIFCQDASNKSKLCSLIDGVLKIVASNSKILTSNALIHPDYLESYAKDFNKGNAPEWSELTPMQVLFKRFGHLLPDVENEFIKRESEFLNQNLKKSF